MINCVSGSDPVVKYKWTYRLAEKHDATCKIVFIGNEDQISRWNSITSTIYTNLTDELKKEILQQAKDLCIVFDDSFRPDTEIASFLEQLRSLGAYVILNRYNNLPANFVIDNSYFSSQHEIDKFFRERNIVDKHIDEIINLTTIYLEHS